MDHKESLRKYVEYLDTISDDEFLKMYEKAAGIYGLGKKRRLLLKSNLLLET